MPSGATPGGGAGAAPGSVRTRTSRTPTGPTAQAPAAPAAPASASSVGDATDASIGPADASAGAAAGPRALVAGIAGIQADELLLIGRPLIRHHRHARLSRVAFVRRQARDARERPYERKRRAEPNDDARLILQRVIPSSPPRQRMNEASPRVQPRDYCGCPPARSAASSSCRRGRSRRVGPS